MEIKKGYVERTNFVQIGKTDINCLDFALKELENNPHLIIELMILKDEKNKKKFHFLLRKGEIIIESVRNKVYKSVLEFGVIPKLKNEEPILLIQINKRLARLLSILFRKKLEKINNFTKKYN